MSKYLILGLGVCYVAHFVLCYRSSLRGVIRSTCAFVSLCLLLIAMQTIVGVQYAQQQAASEAAHAQPLPPPPMQQSLAYVEADSQD